MSKYDTVIIGAGLSGLAAGIRLAHFEKSVCLLERHTTIGGLNSFYRLRKRDHDVGLHAVTNFAKPGTKTGPLSKLLRQLRLSWDDFALVPQNGSAIAFPGKTIRFDNDFTLLESEIADSFPAEIDGFRKLLTRIDEHNELALDRQELSGYKVVSEFISDPLLVDMLFCPLMFYGSATPRDMDFNQFVIMFKSIFREGFGRPFGGVRPLLKALVKKYRGVGGELRLRTGVKRLLHQNGKVTGVELNNGEIIEADNVLSSAGSVETLSLCEPGNETTHPEILPASLEPGGISFVETIFSLDVQPEELRHRETIIFYNPSDPFHYECPNEPCDLRSGIICSPNNFQYDEPLNDGRVRITALANPEFWMNQPSEESYIEQKTKWGDLIAEAAVKHMPDFRPHVVDTDVFTPRTIKKFTGHINGAVYGAPKKVVDGKTGLSNLYLCGTDQGFLGIIGSMLSGISIANAYLLR